MHQLGVNLFLWILIFWCWTPKNQKETLASQLRYHVKCFYIMSGINSKSRRISYSSMSLSTSLYLVAVQMSRRLVMPCSTVWMSSHWASSVSLRRSMKHASCSLQLSLSCTMTFICSVSLNTTNTYAGLFSALCWIKQDSQVSRIERDSH